MGNPWKTVQGEKSRMDKIVDKTWIGGVEIASPPQPIRKNLRGLDIPRFIPPDDDFAYLRPYGNDQLNSRAATQLTQDPWRPLWNVDLDDHLDPRFILSDGENILLQGDSRWQLFDMTGRALKIGGLGSSGMVLDPKYKLFYLMDGLGYLSAWHLADGRLSFLIGVDFGNHFFRSFIRRRANSLIVTGVERRIVPEGPPPQNSLLQIIDLGEPPKVEKDFILSSFKTRVSYMRRSRRLLASCFNDTLVCATENNIYLADLDGNMKKAFTGTFIPLALSLDEGKRIYLIVLDQAGKYALWVVTEEGEQVLEGPLPNPPEHEFISPLVGYDHRIFVMLEARILALNLKGESPWSAYTAGPIAGALVTADDRLLVTEGSYLMAYDRKGERRPLQTFEGETLRTQPLLTKQGLLFVATAEKLYCLKR